MRRRTAVRNTVYVEGQLRSEKFLMLRGLNETVATISKPSSRVLRREPVAVRGLSRISTRALLAKGMKKREGRGVALLSPCFRLSRGKTYPMGVLLELAPEPEVSTRITPD